MPLLIQHSECRTDEVVALVTPTQYPSMSGLNPVISRVRGGVQERERVESRIDSDKELTVDSKPMMVMPEQKTLIIMYNYIISFTLNKKE